MLSANITISTANTLIADGVPFASTIQQDATISQLIELTTANGISGVPVMRGEDLIGIVTRRDLRFETNPSRLVQEVMTPKEKLVTVNEGASTDEVKRLLHKHRIERILVVDEEFDLVGMITVKDYDKAEQLYRKATKAYAKGELPMTALHPEERFEAALKAGIYTKEEADFMRQYETVVLEMLTVDDFPFDEFARNKETVIDHNPA